MNINIENRVCSTGWHHSHSPHRGVLPYLRGQTLNGSAAVLPGREARKFVQQLH